LCSKRPLSYLISALPGSGKSFLVSELTRAVGGQFIEVNVSQMASVNDLQNAIADVAAIYSDARRPVLFIDEADTRVGGEYAFGLLLSVVWESRVRVFPRTFQLPRRLVIVMVVSTALETLGTFPKGPDLRSRINGGELQLPEPQPLDRALLAGVALKRHQPGIVEVERGFFDMVAEARVSARDIESFVVRIRPSSNGLLRLTDIDEELAIRHGFKPAVWASPRGRSTVRVL